MKTETIVMCVVALILGMLMANMLKSVCGCKTDVVEGIGELCNGNRNYTDDDGNCLKLPLDKNWCNGPDNPCSPVMAEWEYNRLLNRSAAAAAAAAAAAPDRKCKNKFDEKCSGKSLNDCLSCVSNQQQSLKAAGCGNILLNKLCSAKEPALVVSKTQ